MGGEKQPRPEREDTPREVRHNAVVTLRGTGVVADKKLKDATDSKR